MHVAGERGARVGQETGVLHRGRADDDVARRRCRGTARWCRGRGCRRRAGPGSVPRPPSTMARITLSFFGRPGRGAVQIDHVQPPRALLDPVLRHRAPGRRKRRWRLAMSPCLRRTHCAVLQVDRRDDQHRGAGGGKRVVAQRVAAGWAQLRGLPRRRRVGTRLSGRLPRNEVGEQPQSRRLAFLRVELHGENVIARHRAGKREPVAPCRAFEAALRGHRSSSCARSRSGCRRGMPSPQRRAPPTCSHLVPTHVRHLERACRARRAAGRAGSAAPRPREDAEAGRVALLAPFEQHLHADADAEERLLPRARHDRRAQAARSISRMQSGIAPWPGKTTRSAPSRLASGIARDHHRAARRDVLDRLRHRAQVAHAVVDDGDVAAT